MLYSYLVIIRLQFVFFISQWRVAVDATGIPLSFKKKIHFSLISPIIIENLKIKLSYENDPIGVCINDVQGNMYVPYYKQLDLLENLLLSFHLSCDPAKRLRNASSNVAFAVLQSTCFNLEKDITRWETSSRMRCRPVCVDGMISSK